MTFVYFLLTGVHFSFLQTFFMPGEELETGFAKLMVVAYIYGGVVDQSAVVLLGV